MKDERCVCVSVYKGKWVRKEEHLFLGNSFCLLAFLLLGQFMS